MKVIAIKTDVFHVGDNLEEFIWKNIKSSIKEKSVIAITSKIISLAEKCLRPKDSISKKDLIREEADHFLCETAFGVCLTVKEGLVIPSAGIDESNSETGDYILYPEKPYESAKRIYDYVKSKSGLKNIGIIITDSHTTALRKGVVGIALSHWGFNAIKNIVGEEDLFGRKLRMTSVNVLDALAVSAVLLMGESAECQPIAMIEYDGVEFSEKTSVEEIKIPLEEDLYGPLLTAMLCDRSR